MELKELQEKLNKRHVKIRVPKIYGESYAVQYARLLKNFTDNIVENFSSLVMAIYELTEENVKKAILDSSPTAQDDTVGAGCPVACVSAGAFTATKRGFSNSGTNLKIKVNKDAACLVVAHYLMIYEMPEDSTAGSSGNSGGIVNSASVGDVSVGMQAKPINDMFEDFMASTVYGRDFLAWLASVGGALLIN